MLFIYNGDYSPAVPAAVAATSVAVVIVATAALVLPVMAAAVVAAAVVAVAAAGAVSGSETDIDKEPLRFEKAASDGGGKAKKMKLSRRKSLRKRHGRKSRRRL